MASWGTKLYQSDVAEMVRDDYKNKLRSGKSDREVLEEMLMEYQNEMNDEEDKFDFWPALADTMWKYGRLIPEIRDVCLSIIAATHEDIRWETEKDKAKRQKEMQILEEKLLSEMPAKKKVSVHKPYVCDWKEREVYSMQIEDDGKDGKYNGCYIIIYVVGMVRGAYAVPDIYDTVPEVYLMLSKEQIEQVEDIKNLKLCCSVYYKERNERRINYLIYETSNRKRPKSIRYIGRMKEKFVPHVEYQIQDMNSGMLWCSWVQDAIRDYEFSLKIDREIQEKLKEG